MPKNIVDVAGLFENILTTQVLRSIKKGIMFLVGKFSLSGPKILVRGSQILASAGKLGTK